MYFMGVFLILSYLDKGTFLFSFFLITQEFLLLFGGSWSFWEAERPPEQQGQNLIEVISERPKSKQSFHSMGEFWTMRRQADFEVLNKKAPENSEA